MDLTAPKNAYMLFRFAKVFSLPNLSDMVSMGKFFTRDTESFAGVPPVDRIRRFQDIISSIYDKKYDHNR